MQNTSFLCRKSPLEMLSSRCTTQSLSTLRMLLGVVTCLPGFSRVPRSFHWCVGVFWRVALPFTAMVCCCWQGKGLLPSYKTPGLVLPPSLLSRCSCSSGEHCTRPFCLRSSVLTWTAWGVGFGEGSLLLSGHGLLFSWVTVPGGREKGWFVCVTRPLAERQNDGCSVHGYFFPLPFYVSVGFMLSLATYRLPSPWSVPLSFCMSYLGTNCDGCYKHRLGLVSVSPGSSDFLYSVWCSDWDSPKLSSQPRLISLQ